jgi:hypothetical protein
MSENIVCEPVTLEPSTTLTLQGKGNTIHPLVSFAGEGEIVVGSQNIIEEGVKLIIHPSSSNGREDEEQADSEAKMIMKIGDGNYFQVRSIFEGVSMGDNCTLEPNGKNLHYSCP